MEQLARIVTRRETLTELGELVRALRSMAASRVREAQEALEGTRAFRAIVERSIAEIAPLAAWPGSPQQGDARILMVITSQNGFAGGFNERLTAFALSERLPGERLIIVGRRGAVAAAAHDVTPDQTYTMVSRAAAVALLARRISVRFAALSSARIVHAHHTRGADYEPRVRSVLPVPPLAHRPQDSAPLHHLPPDRLMLALASEYFFAEVADALMDSLASENAARLRTMDAASHNIDDKLDHLRHDEHAARQAEMTSDMIDIVTGAEAVSDAD